MDGINEFEGDVFNRPDEDYIIKVGAGAQVQTKGRNATDASKYNFAAYCYGISSHNERCRPYRIYNAKNENDVIKVVRLASKLGVGLAVQTGGHHYGCFNSTTGENLQLNVRNCFTRKEYDTDLDVITIGVSISCIDLDEWMGKLVRSDKKKGSFIPHGQCGTVCIGGHAQSGGYSALLGRSFGYFADHILQFKIICPPKEKGGEPTTHTITKPKYDADTLKPQREKPDYEFNDDLYWAVLGGAPGGFGVLCEVKFKPLWDSNYPNARAKFYILPYNIYNIERALTVVADMNDKKDLPDDYNISVGVICGNPTFRWGNTSIDGRMSYFHPSDNPPVYSVKPTIMLKAVYANLEGKNSADEKTVEAWFTTIESCLAYNSLGYILWTYFYNFWHIFWNIPTTIPWLLSFLPMILPKPNSTLSEVTRAEIFIGKQRLQNNPYKSAVYLTPRQNITSSFEQDFVKESVYMLDKAIKTKGLNPDFEWAVMGGKMKGKKKGPQDNALPFRNAQFLSFLYLHYDSVKNNKNTPEIEEDAKQQIEAICECMAGTEETDSLMMCDNQWVAFPNAETYSVDDNVLKFFDSQENYDRIKKIRDTIDPLKIFVANRGMVGGIAKFPIPEHD